MEWEKQPPQQAEEPNGGGMFVKVMTDEQIEVLRKQIAAYATICDQLVEMHKSLTAQNDLPGMRLGNLYCDPLISSGTHKITGRQRWTPTPTQLQLLERMFDQGIGTPSKQKIKEITAELSQHGQISETNVYNWFQNRRARSKRKQTPAPANNDGSELEIEVESSDEKKTKQKEIGAEKIVTSTAEDPCFQDPSVEPQNDKIDAALPPDGNSKSCDDFSPMPFYGGVLSNTRMEHFIGGKMEASGNYNPYMQEDDYNME